MTKRIFFSFFGTTRKWSVIEDKNTKRAMCARFTFN